jgi:hypothetical protein
MAQLGSVFVTSVKALRLCGYQKLYSMAMARSNCAWTSALQEIGKWTLPSFSGPLAFSCAATTEAPKNTKKVMH